MPKKIKFRVNVTKPGALVVEVDTVAQALYVYFQRGVKAAQPPDQPGFVLLRQFVLWPQAPGGCPPAVTPPLTLRGRA